MAILGLLFFQTDFKIFCSRSSHHGTAETNPTRNHEVAGLIPKLAQWAKDPALLQLTAVAQIQSLAQELLYAVDVAIKFFKIIIKVCF